MNYRAFTPKNVLSVDSFFSIHYFAYAKNFVFTGERHDFWEMAYVDNGDVGVMADTTGYTLRQGEAIFHKPMEYHNIWANGRYAHVLILSFSSKSPLMAFFKNKILTLDQEDKRLLQKIIEEARRTFVEPLDIVDLPCVSERTDAPAGGSQLVRIYTEALLIGLARKNSAVPHAERISEAAADENEDKIVQAIRDYLAADLTREVTLDDICAMLCFSKTYLKALFKKRMGMGIIQYFIHMKIKAAKCMIGDGEMTCSQIAEACGFSSVHYFSRTFKAHTGMTPTAYARSVQNRKLL
ncbi:MAG: AraC family transcriptional regulator [Clostridia bacterium]|nr:AraC family transcriptional regulator [Clostridia bacterium]